MAEHVKGGSVVVHGDNTGIIITGNNSTVILNRENLLKQEIVISTFKSYYQNYFDTISLLIEDNKKPIDDIYVNLAIIREEKEEDIQDKSKLLDRDKIINSYEEIYKPKKPISIEELIKKSLKNNSAKALIYGKAGIGKTTFCKYIAYKWAKEELYSEFENIIYIPLREWKDDGLESIIKKIYFQEKHKDHVIEIDQSKTLFLFDGYDELSDTSLLYRAIKTYTLQNYIITSRPYGYRKSDFDVNEVFETIGFTDENVEEYIDKFFTESNYKINLENFLSENINIKHIAYIPLMLEMICSLWKEKSKMNQSFLSPMTMTELYGEVIEYIFFEYTETNDTAYIQEKENEIFEYLGKIAFEGLRNQAIVLDKTIIKEKKDFFVDYVLKTGFLRSNRKHRNQLMNSYEFPHLTFQEYFAALYVSKLHKDEISEIVCNYKFYPYMQVFFVFLGGLIEDKNYFINQISEIPKDIFGFYEHVMILRSLNEISLSDIDDKKRQEINIDLEKWLRFTVSNSENYKIIFEKIKIIPSFLDMKVINLLIEFLVDKNIEYEIKVHIPMILAKLVRNDSHTINSLLAVINIVDFNIYIKQNIIKSLFDIGDNNTKFVDFLIDYIKNENSLMRSELANSVYKIGRDDYLIKVLIEGIRDDNISINIRSYLVKALIKLQKLDIKVINHILEFFENFECLRLNDCYKLLNNHIVDNEQKGTFIDILINSLDRCSFDSDALEIIKILINYQIVNDSLINALLKLLAKKSQFYESHEDTIFIINTLNYICDIDEKYIYAVLAFIQNESTPEVSRLRLIYFLPKLVSDENFLIDITVAMIKNYKNNSDLVEMLHFVLLGIKKMDQKIVKILIESIKSNIINLLNGINIGFKDFVELEIDNRRFIESLIGFINDSSIDIDNRISIIYDLSDLFDSDSLFLDSVFIFLKDKSIAAIREQLIIASNIKPKIHHFKRILADIILNFIKDESIEDSDKYDLFYSLEELAIKDQSFIDNLIKIVKDEKINSFVRGNIANVLLELEIEDKKIFEIVIEFIRDENIEDSDKNDLFGSLGKLAIKRQSFINNLIKIVKDEKINSFVRGNIANVLLELEIEDKKIFEIVIEFIRDESIEDSDKNDLFGSLGKLEIKRQSFINNLIKIVEDEKIDSYVRGKIANVLLKLEIDDKKIFEIVIEFIRDESIEDSDKNDLFGSLGKLEIKDQSFIDNLIIAAVVDVLIEHISKKNLDFRQKEYFVYWILKNSKNPNEKTINGLIDFFEYLRDDTEVGLWKSQSEEVNLLQLLEITDFLLDSEVAKKRVRSYLIGIIQDKSISLWFKISIAQQLAKTTYIDFTIIHNIHIEVFKGLMKYSSPSNIFMAFDNANITFDILVKYLFYKKLPIYIKENKICTIYKNKELRTQKKVSLRPEFKSKIKFLNF